MSSPVWTPCHTGAVTWPREESNLVFPVPVAQHQAPGTSMSGPASTTDGHSGEAGITTPVWRE
jgi:hypothetical protein